MSEPTEHELRLFLEGALDSDAEKRVADAIAASPTLQAKLEDLPQDDFIERLKLAREAEETFANTSWQASGKGRIVGNYKLIERIGEGGMGQVWLAEQEVPISRKVALKFLKRGMDSPSLVSRFKREIESMALMDHPSIARIHDGGTTEEGQPYYVMEWIDGTPITAYCDAKRLNIAQRLTLFSQVCHAAQHAHQKRRIHRDLKPSNILVTEVDGMPTAKIIDFGLAKDFDELAERTQISVQGNIVGTLKYMSPEQAQHKKSDIDTRADIYSLGVVLYELLTGTTPIEEESIQKKAIFQTLEDIRLKEPPRPSERLSSSGNRTSIGAQRQISPGRLKLELQGDLDWVVMKALEKSPEKRYPTAIGFAEDIQRYLQGQPVYARQSSTVYKLRKFVKKHRASLLVTSGLIVLGIVIGGLVWRQVKLNDQRLSSLDQSAARAYNYGNLPVAREQFQEALELQPGNIRRELKFLRASFGESPRSELITQLEALRPAAKLPGDVAELDFVLGDLLSCENKRQDEAKLHLERALASGQLAPADAEYAAAIVADSVKQCEQHLKQAINLEKFHHRANVLLAALQLSMGQIAEAKRNSEFLLRTFSSDRSLASVLETCHVLTNDDYEAKELSERYAERLTDLLNAYTGKVNDSPQAGKENLTFARQAAVAMRAAKLISEIPLASDTPGLPIAPFTLRSKEWKQLAALATVFAPPQSALDLPNIIFANREKALKDLEQLAATETDGMALQIYGVAKFAEYVPNYGKWDTERSKQAVMAIADIECRCIASETLAPRSQFEFAARWLRIMSDFQLTREFGVVDPVRERRVRDDVQYIFANSGKYPVFRDSMGALLLELFIQPNKEPIQVDNADNLVLGLPMLADWIAAAPTNTDIRVVRSRVWKSLGRTEDAIKDAKAVLEINPEHAVAQKLLAELEGTHEADSQSSN
ncbi:MAG: protein kinase [Pirellulaceae bacterium]|nr:protein kinase [Pirellulaceae bacterium]